MCQLDGYGPKAKNPADLDMTILHSGQEAASCTARLFTVTVMIPILFTCLWDSVIPPVALGMMAATVSAVLVQTDRKGDRVSLSPLRHCRMAGKHPCFRLSVRS